MNKVFRVRFIRWLNIGPVANDLPQLAQIGRELARHIVPGDVGGGVENARGLLVWMVGPEVGEETSADRLALPT